MSSSPKFEFFWKKNQKCLILEKFEEKGYFEKKRFHLFKRHLEQNWRVESLPVVAGRLALKYLQIHDVNLYEGSLIEVI